MNYSDFKTKALYKECIHTVCSDAPKRHLFLKISIVSSPNIVFRKEILFGVDAKNDFMSYQDLANRFLRNEDKTIGIVQGKVLDLIIKDRGYISDIVNDIPIHVGTIDFMQSLNFYYEENSRYHIHPSYIQFLKDVINYKP